MYDYVIVYVIARGVKMKKNYLLIIILLVLFVPKIYATEAELCQVSEAYLEWINMDSEEQKKYMMPEYCEPEIEEEEKDEEEIESKTRGLFNKKLGASSYPSFYIADSTPVKNQKQTSTCWAFSSTTVLESYLLKKYNKTYTLSPGHLNYMESQSFYDTLNTHGPIRWVNDGGNYGYSSVYYINRYGPVNESDSPTNTDVENLEPVYIDTIVGKKNVIDVNNIQYNYRTKSGSCTASEINKIKSLITKYGPTGASIFMDDSLVTPFYSSYMYKSNRTNTLTNHTVTIVGWNDDYSASRFEPDASRNGAWIVQNSYGTEFGNKGLFYISYDDDEVCTSIFSIRDADTNFSDNKYILSEQPYLSTTKLTTQMTVFTKKKNGTNEKLNKVSFETLGPTNYKVYYYKGNAAKKKIKTSKMTLIASGSVDYPGWVTIKPSKNIVIPSSTSNYSIAVVFSKKLLPLVTNVQKVYDTNLKMTKTYNSPEIFKKGVSYVYEKSAWRDTYSWFRKNNYKVNINAFTDNNILNMTSTKVEYSKDDYIDIIFGFKGTYNGKFTKLKVVKDGNTLIESEELNLDIEKGQTYSYLIRKEGLNNFANGKYQVKVSASNGTTYSKDLNINVIPISGVKITNKTGLKLGVGKTLSLNTVVTPSNFNSISPVLTWKSSNESIATVDNNGLVSAVNVGNVTITATTKNNKVAKYNLIVDRPIESVVVNKTSVILNPGETYNASAYVLPTNTTDDKTITWISDNNKRVEVTNNGVIKAIASGKIDVIATSSNNKKGTISVFVTGVSLKEDEAKVELFETYDLEPLVINKSGTASQNVTLISSNPSVASVSASGIVTAHKLGTTTITALDTYGRSTTSKITVTKIQAKNLTVNEIGNKTFNGKAQKPKITVKYKGNTLKNKTDYTISYSNNKKPGKATVTIKVKSNNKIYEGTKKVNFIIKPKKEKIKSLKTTSKAIKVSYEKQSSVSGYQISYRVKGTSTWKTINVTGTSKKITGLIKNKKYQVKVRSYKKIDNKNYYGFWSNTKTIKCK